MRHSCANMASFHFVFVLTVRHAHTAVPLLCPLMDSRHEAYWLLSCPTTLSASTHSNMLSNDELSRPLDAGTATAALAHPSSSSHPLQPVPAAAFERRPEVWGEAALQEPSLHGTTHRNSRKRHNSDEGSEQYAPGNRSSKLTPTDDLVLYPQHIEETSNGMGPTHCHSRRGS